MVNKKLHPNAHLQFDINFFFTFTIHGESMKRRNLVNNHRGERLDKVSSFREGFVAES